MTIYFIEENNQIIGFDTNKARLELTIKMPQYAHLEIKETERPIVNFQFADTEEYRQEQIKRREEQFKAAFFEIPDLGWYRKIPKGYSSAIESINTAFNAVLVLNSLPANYLIFYTKPDFNDEKQCTEEWLIANQFSNKDMTKEEFMQFYANFVTVWNNMEHLKDESEEE